MLTVYSGQHVLRDPQTELHGGELVSPFECPARADYIFRQIKKAQLGEIIEPQSFGLAPLLRVHDAAYIEFLQTCWSRWQATGYSGEAIPTIFPTRGMYQHIPNSIEGQLGYYALAADTSINQTSWDAARISADTALTAQSRVSTDQVSVFALCRPPGHHAARDLFGGYCFINNAAICAQAFVDQGANRVAMIDVDFHHGNGTQSIFYHRDDVLFISLHGDPVEAFPYFSGYVDETGTGEGNGFNVNYPLPKGSDYVVWESAFKKALTRVRCYLPDVLIVSLGVDTYENDPISFFRLKSEDFKRFGALIGQLHLPTLFVLEGGYAVDEIGINTVNVLTGFEGE